MTPISPVFSNISSGISKFRWTNLKTDPVEQRRAQSVDFMRDMPWVRDNAIATALTELNGLIFSTEDLDYLKKMGIEIPFYSGKEAFDFIEKENIRIIFDTPAEAGVHAQYDFYKNIITINKKYKNTTDFAVMLAIAEAILHEAGHAKDKDGYSSIQEELNFLGMNAVAHRAFLKKYTDIFSDSQEPIIKDGVSLYAKLFFDKDENKKALIKRIKEKYGDLPAGDRLHPPGKIARSAKRTIVDNTLYCYFL